jgi:alpha-L-fucosidase 2
MGIVSPAVSDAPSDNPQTPSQLTLWYSQPGNNPENDGMAIGNGRLGALVLGGYPKDEMVFNEDSLWTGGLDPSSDYNKMGAYEKFGDVTINFDNAGAVSQYRRSLDLTTAVASVNYVADGVTYHRESFASHPDNTIISRLTADRPHSYSGTITLNDGHTGTISTDGNAIVDSGRLPNGEMYEARLAVSADGGQLTVVGTSIRFQGCTSLIMVLGAATNYVMDPTRRFLGNDPHERVKADVAAASAKSYDDLKAAHIADYKSLFDRVTIDLGSSTAEQQAMPTNFRRTKDGHGDDPALESLLFQYGRYLLIADSRPGSLPANLNGLWCDNHIICHCDYHTNINIQMCYWPAEVANLSECHMPFFDLTDSQLPDWRTFTAEDDKEYNASIPEDKVRGFDIRTSHNIWGGQGWLPNRGANAWYCLHYWEHYAFTGDTEFLKNRAYPIMKEVCQYWQDHLKTLPDGRLVVPKGWSPEQPTGPLDGTSYQQELVYNLFTNYMAASDILGVDADYRKTISDLRDKLLVPAIGSRGQLQEWMKDQDSKEPNHRHTSHLLAVYPGNQITLDGTPELAKAAKQSLIERGLTGNTEWSFVHRAAIWSRLGERESAHQLLASYVATATEPNLFGNCGSAEQDGPSGFTAAVAEMLLQSQNGEIDLLPALPAAWPTGSVKGLRARGGFTVDIDWKDRKVTNYRITSAQALSVEVRSNGEVKTIVSEKP